MKKYFKRLTAILCIIFLFSAFQFNYFTASAEPNDTIAEIINSNPAVAGLPNQSKPVVPETTYNYHFLFENNSVLKGIFSTAQLYFYVQEYWNVKYVYAQIEYDISRIITEGVPASLTFSVNNKPVYSCRVSYENNQSQVVYVPIPVNALNEGYNVFNIAGYVKIFGAEGCSEEFSGANWISINKNSFICVGYELMNNEHKISYFPYPFISTVDPNGEGTAILVSDYAANGELAAAMYLMANMSTEVKDENHIFIGRYREASSSKARKKIVISLTENVPEDLKVYLQEGMNNVGNGEGAMDLSSRVWIHLTSDSNGDPLLLIISDKESNLMEAIHMLFDENRLSQEKVSTTFVYEGSSQIGYEANKFNQILDGNYTVKDIAGQGMMFIGPFHQEQILYLPFKNDYVLSSSGKISLKFRYSDNLDFNRSLITVYWGNIPVASKKLSGENAGNDELTFTMPVDVVGTTAKSIKIAFDLEIRDLLCSMRQDQMPWAYVTEDSQLYLPSQVNTNLSFDYIPFPFQNSGIFSDVMIVTSDEPDSTELNLLGKIIALYGEDVNAYGDLKVIKASEFSENDADYHIITAGIPKNNRFLRSLNQNLYFQYNEAGDAFLSNKRLVLADQYARQTVAIQLLESPYEEERAVLAVCCTGQDTMQLALNFFSSSKKRWELTGDCVLLDADMEMKSFELIDSAHKNKPSIKEFVKTNKQSIVFTVTAAAAMVMLLMAAVLILIRARMHK